MTKDDLDFLCALVRVRSGLVIRGERGFYAETRLAPLARREGLASVADLVQKLRASLDDRALVQAAVEAMSLQETWFFRDREAFKTLTGDVWPKLAAARAGPLRCWSAGCGTGQEAYSLAMLAKGPDGPGVEVGIFASDLSSVALEKAESGLYTHFEVQRGLPIRLLLKHFERADDAWRVNPDLRQAVRWRRLNLVDDFNVATPFDLVLCRNVLSGFDEPTRAATLDRLTRALAPDGRLMLGLDEPAPAGFVEEGETGIFRRLGLATEAAA